jgi:hypothetical protein
VSVLSEIADYLESAGKITPEGSALSELPDKPDDLVVLYEIQGLPPGFVHGPMSASYEYPRIRVLTRSKDYDTAKAKAQDLFRTLGSVVNATLSGVRYLRITPMRTPYQIQRDANDRTLIACEYQVHKESVG